MIFLISSLFFELDPMRFLIFLMVNGTKQDFWWFQMMFYQYLLVLDDVSMGFFEISQILKILILTFKLYIFEIHTFCHILEDPRSQIVSHH